MVDPERPQMTIWRTPCFMRFSLYSAGLTRDCGLSTVWLSSDYGYLVDLSFSLSFPSPLVTTCLRYSDEAIL